MMRHEIPRSQWPRFFEDFGATHHGHLCSLAISTPNRDRRFTCPPLPFTAIQPDRADDESRVHVFLTDWDGDQLEYAIETPLHVFHEQTPADVSETIKIDGAGSHLTMTFAAPV